MNKGSLKERLEEEFGGKEIPIDVFIVFIKVCYLNAHEIDSFIEEIKEEYDTIIKASTISGFSTLRTAIFFKVWGISLKNKDKSQFKNYSEGKYSLEDITKVLNYMYLYYKTTYSFICGNKTPCSPKAREKDSENIYEMYSVVFNNKE